MSLRTWTRDELLYDCISITREEAWRLVEAQHAASTMKLTDTLEEQVLLEPLIESSKPKLPQACSGLHFLLSSPFRYAPYPHGSRFRRSGMTPGVFYCSEQSSTAVAELAFYRLLFYAESPGTAWPRNAGEYTGFCVELSADKVIDLRSPPFDAFQSDWEDRSDYAACQAMEAQCRAVGIQVIRYRSVRDPSGGNNYAVLGCDVFAQSTYTKLESWKLHLGPSGVRAVREFPFASLEFDRAAFAMDTRLSSIVWDR